MPLRGRRLEGDCLTSPAAGGIDDATVLPSAASAASERARRRHAVRMAKTRPRRASPERSPVAAPAVPALACPSACLSQRPHAADCARRSNCESTLAESGWRGGYWLDPRRHLLVHRDPLCHAGSWLAMQACGWESGAVDGALGGVGRTGFGSMVEAGGWGVGAWWGGGSWTRVGPR
jgi:hypothetical protein